MQTYISSHMKVGAAKTCEIDVSTAGIDRGGERANRDAEAAAGDDEDGAVQPGDRSEGSGERDVLCRSSIRNIGNCRTRCIC